MKNKTSVIEISVAILCVISVCSGFYVSNCMDWTSHNRAIGNLVFTLLTIYFIISIGWYFRKALFNKVIMLLSEKDTKFVSHTEESVNKKLYGQKETISDEKRVFLHCINPDTGNPEIYAGIVDNN